MFFLHLSKFLSLTLIYLYTYFKLSSSMYLFIHIVTIYIVIFRHLRDLSDTDFNEILTNVFTHILFLFFQLDLEKNHLYLNLNFFYFYLGYFENLYTLRYSIFLLLFLFHPYFILSRNFLKVIGVKWSIYHYQRGLKMSMIYRPRRWNLKRWQIFHAQKYPAHDPKALKYSKL